MARSLVGQEDVTLRTFAAGARDALGEYVEGAASDSIIKASIQALNGRDLQSLPEGERQKDWQKVYTLATLKTASQYDRTGADHIIVDGISYEVQQVWPWRAASPIPHFKAFIVRVQEVAP